MITFTDVELHKRIKDFPILVRSENYFGAISIDDFGHLYITFKSEKIEAGLFDDNNDKIANSEIHFDENSIHVKLGKFIPARSINIRYRQYQIQYIIFREELNEDNSPIRKYNSIDIFYRCSDSFQKFINNQKGELQNIDLGNELLLDMGAGQNITYSGEDEKIINGNYLNIRIIKKNASFSIGEMQSLAFKFNSLLALFTDKPVFCDSIHLNINTGNQIIPDELFLSPLPDKINPIDDLAGLGGQLNKIDFQKIFSEILDKKFNSIYLWRSHIELMNQSKVYMDQDFRILILCLETICDTVLKLDWKKDKTSFVSKIKQLYKKISIVDVENSLHNVFVARSDLLEQNAETIKNLRNMLFHEGIVSDKNLIDKINNIPMFPNLFANTIRWTIIKYLEGKINAK